MSFTFFRKYNKLILAVGGSLLMVIFLIPQAGNLFQGDPGEQAFGWIGEQKVTVARVQVAEREVRLLRGLHPALDRLTSEMMLVRKSDEQPVIWMLMAAEAEQQGLYAGAGEVEALLRDLQLDPAKQAEAMRRVNANTALLHQALRHFLMTRKLHTMVYNPRPPLSEQALRKIARDSESRITVKMLAVPAEDFVDDEPEPTPQRLAELFGRFADPQPGDENPYGLNYQLPDRVKLEYIAVTLDSAIAAVRAEANADDLFQRAHQYYRDHPAEFFPDPIDPTAEDLAEQKIDASTLERKPFAEVRREVEDRLVRADAEALRDKAINTIVYALQKSSNEWPHGESGYRHVPEASQWLPLESLQERVQADDKLLPVVQRFEDAWMTRQDIDGLEGFGASSRKIRASSEAEPVASYIAECRELNPAAGASSRLQVGVASNPTVDDEGNKYIFRLIAAEKSRAPTDLAEVKDRVVEDAKRISAYDKLTTAKADAYLAKAKAEGLARLAESLGEDKEVDTIGPFTRYDVRYLPKPFIDGVFERAAGIIAAGDLEKIAQADRYAVIPVERLRSIYLVEYTGYSPFTANLLNAQKRVEIVGRLGQERFVIDRFYTGNYPFTYEAISQRLGFVMDGEKPQQKEAPEMADATE